MRGSSLWLLSLAVFWPVAAQEKAAYDSHGRIIALLPAGEDVDVSTNVVAVLPSGKRVPLLVRREGRGTARTAAARQWTCPFQLPDGGRGRLELRSEEGPDAVRYTTSLTAESPLEVDAIELLVDVPRDVFLGGRFAPGGSQATALDIPRTAGPDMYRGTATGLNFTSRDSLVRLDLDFGPTPEVRVTDRWDAFGRSYRVHVPLVRGAQPANANATLTATLRLKRDPAPLTPVRIQVDTAKVRFRFDGFGGNYCWNNQSPITAYTLDNLKLAWARTEMKVVQWDKQRDNPGPELRADMAVMKRFQAMGVPYITSVWWLPERFYTDPYEKPRSAHFRLIKPEKWDELLEVLTGYLLWAKRDHGVEPDMFSFNESNIGVYVGQTPEAHTEALKRIGAAFRKAGLKTKMLLGDATGPRDTHRFVLEAAADPEAMQYVGAIGFHSWGGGTPEQYKAWGDVAEWLGLPLLVTELGVDAAAYYTRSWDSYHYGLREARMTQELLLHARPQGTQFWQFTNDYALARAGADGKVEPTPRLWLMKHFTDLTPQKSEALSVTSDQAGVLGTAFRKNGTYAIHLLNLGAGRSAVLNGLPGAVWETVETTESAQYQKRSGPQAGVGGLEVELPARSLVTLVGQEGERGGQ